MKIPSHFAEGRKIWSVDSEFSAPPGEPPAPHVVCAKELRSGQEVVIWCAGPEPVADPPWDPEEDIVLDYAGCAEHGVFLALGWKFPKRHWDWLVELKVLYGTQLPPGANSWKLLDQCVAHDIRTMDSEEKQRWRALAIRGGPFTQEEREGLTAYCWEDVYLVEKLFHRTAPRLWKRDRWSDQAYLRGNAAQCFARMERRGIPIDTATWDLLKTNWNTVLNELTAQVVKHWPVFKWLKKEARYGVDFVAWAETMKARKIPWPRTDSGRPATDGDTLRDMSTAFPQLAPLVELMATRSQFRLGPGLAIGADGRNRTGLMPFTSSTGRCQPSNAAFIFGPSCWVRYLITPAPGTALAYVDLSAAEIGIAAILSGDHQLWEDYATEPYVRFGVAAGLIPSWGSKKTHPVERDQAKNLMLGVGYGMGIRALARKLNVTIDKARDLLGVHRLRYHAYWSFSQRTAERAKKGIPAHTCYGWRWTPLRDGGGVAVLDRGERSVRNWPMQATCASILHRAVILAQHRGIRVLASVHDALLVEAPEDQILEVAKATEKVWGEASRLALKKELRSSTKVINPGERFVEGRGTGTWNLVQTILGHLSDPNRLNLTIS